jgi:hypothetical protein
MWYMSGVKILEWDNKHILATFFPGIITVTEVYLQAHFSNWHALLVLARTSNDFTNGVN